jgi:DNA repair protein RecO (recombination protein O)
MKENYYAISLGKKDIGEADRLYVFYTREKGLVRVSARGVRKASARLSGHIEDYSVSHISIARNNGPGTLAGAYSEHSFGAIRESYVALESLERVKKYVTRLVQAEQPDERIFVLLLTFFIIVESCAKEGREAEVQFLANVFLLKLYDVLGYKFLLRQCATCGEKLTKDRHVFSAYGGGVVCAACARNERFGITLDIDTQKTLRLIATNNLEQLQKVKVSDRVVQQSQSLANHIIEWILR